jgi:phage baseplate assembly protein W
MTIYRGFSTYNRIRKYRATDFDLVKQDLFNHFNIRKGEKLMNPNFGTIIWNLLFDPLTDETRQLVVEDVQAICAYDPRINLDEIVVNTYQHGINVELSITYLTENKSGQISLNFDNRTNELIAR